MCCPVSSTITSSHEWPDTWNIIDSHCIWIKPSFRPFSLVNGKLTLILDTVRPSGSIVSVNHEKFKLLSECRIWKECEKRMKEHQNWCKRTKKKDEKRETNSENAANYCNRSIFQDENLMPVIMDSSWIHLFRGKMHAVLCESIVKVAHEKCSVTSHKLFETNGNFCKDYMMETNWLFLNRSGSRIPFF